MPNAAERVYAQRPLLAFSWLTATQVDTINSLGVRLLRRLSEAVARDGNGINAPAFFKFYGQFWLWLFAAYEVSRTMAAAERCFSQDAIARLRVLKRQLALLRVPFAKQEQPGTGRAIRGEVAIYRIDYRNRDLVFTVKGESIEARQLVLMFRRTMRAIKRPDVLHPIEYARNGGQQRVRAGQTSPGPRLAAAPASLPAAERDR